MELTLGARSITTGDFNGDGYEDLAAGSPGEDIGTATNAGAVFVNYGGPSGLRGSGRTQLYSGAGLANAAESGDVVGASLAAGDFNDDGFDDLAVGSPGEDSSAANGGLVLTIMGSSNGLNPATAAGGRQGGLFANSDEDGDYLGAALAAGDFNGDGFDDIAAGAPGENSTIADGGIVLTVNGSASGLAAATAGGGRQGGLFANADEAGDYLGAALAVGDFNGDGFDDIAAGAPGENGSAVDGGIVLTVNGSASGLDAATAGGGRQGGLFANTDEAFDYLGASLVAGDFDGDGFGDIAAGAPGENGSAVDGGIVLTVNGSASGLAAATAGGGRQGGLFANTDEDGDYLGTSLAVGDFNGDGFGDLAAGAPGENGSAVDGGIVLTVNGSTSGLDAATAGGGRQGGLFANSDEHGDYLGASLAAGDFNGDCVDDLAAGAPGENSTVADGGILLTVNGSASGLDAATAAGGRQGGFFAGVDEAGDYLAGGSNGGNAPPSHPNSGGAEPPSGNVAPPPGGHPLPSCRRAPLPPGGEVPPEEPEVKRDACKLAVRNVERARKRLKQAQKQVKQGKARGSRPEFRRANKRLRKARTGLRKQLRRRDKACACKLATQKVKRAKKHLKQTEKNRKQAKARGSKPALRRANTRVRKAKAQLRKQRRRRGKACS